MSGLPPAFNLRELRDRIATCTNDVLYHHFCETTLVHHLTIRISAPESSSGKISY
jgi:hypothetical protein